LSLPLDALSEADSESDDLSDSDANAEAFFHSDGDANALRNPAGDIPLPELINRRNCHLSYYCEVTSQRERAILWPSENAGPKSFSLDDLFQFMNELAAEWDIRECGRWHGNGKAGGYFQFTFDMVRLGERSYLGGIRIRIPNRCTQCRIDVSKVWIRNTDDWHREFIPQSHGPGRHCQDGNGIYLITRDIRRPATLTLLRGETLLSCTERDVSRALVYVVNFLTYKRNLARICANPHKKSYLQFLSSVISPPKDAPEKQSYWHFQEKAGGALKLWIHPRWSRDHFQLFKDHNTKYSIIGGCWAHPLAAPILRNRELNRIACVMMDTTWSVMKDYVTAFLVGVSHNTAIPLAFAFGSIEDSNLYDCFFNFFYDKYQINLAQFILESDQGAGLRKFASIHNFTHRFCLRHFLATIKDRIFGAYIHYLVKTRTEAEFNSLREMYRSLIHEVLQRLQMPGWNRALKEFGKAGLTLRYQPGERFPFIEISDPVRWSQVSCVKKYAECLPTTTNCLESLNGHCNADTPRRNCFWGSMIRLARAIDRGIENFSANVRHNFNTATRRSLNLVHVIGEPELTQQEAYYHTNVVDQTCECGDTSYYSRVYRTLIPCCHLLRLGLTRPRMPTPPVLVRSTDNSQVPPFSVDLEKVARPGEEPSPQRRDSLINLSARSIKHLSRSGKNLDEIRTWVTANFPQPQEMVTFVQNIPLPILRLISMGVLQYGS
jgi:hypothetical protein